jgi:hypothetical protein
LQVIGRLGRRRQASERISVEPGKAYRVVAATSAPGEQVQKQHRGIKYFIMSYMYFYIGRVGEKEMESFAIPSPDLSSKFLRISLGMTSGFASLRSKASVRDVQNLPVLAIAICGSEENFPT